MSLLGFLLRGLHPAVAVAALKGELPEGQADVLAGLSLAEQLGRVDWRSCSSRTRACAALALRQAGLSFSDLAGRLGISANTARRLVSEQSRLVAEARLAWALGELSDREAARLMRLPPDEQLKALRGRTPEAGEETPGKEPSGSPKAGLEAEVEALRAERDALLQEVERLRAEKRVLGWELRRERSVVAFLGVARKVFAFLERHEEDFAELARQTMLRGSHAREAERWLALLERYREAVEGALAAPDYAVLDVEAKVQ